MGKYVCNEAQLLCLKAKICVCTYVCYSCMQKLRNQFDWNWERRLILRWISGSKKRSNNSITDENTWQRFTQSDCTTVARDIYSKEINPSASEIRGASINWRCANCYWRATCLVIYFKTTHIIPLDMENFQGFSILWLYLSPYRIKQVNIKSNIYKYVSSSTTSTSSNCSKVKTCVANSWLRWQLLAQSH